MSQTTVPIFDPMIEGNEGKARLSWTLFFQTQVTGDVGTPFQPVAVSLGASGTPILSGIYYQNQGFTDFYITINPNGGNTTSTAGTTYFTLPFDVTLDGSCFAVAGTTGSNAGIVTALNNRAYAPGWSAVTVPLTLTGRVKV